MAYLIDGNNLMGQADPYFKFDPSSRNRLIARLLLFQRITRSRIFLVFDGKPPLDEQTISLNPKFTVLFPEPGQSADQLIEELLSLKKDRRYFLLVSSDRGLKAIARGHGARSMSTLEFLRQLKQTLKDHREERELQKQSEDSTPLEISLWSDLFRKK
ncbi:MAG: NYN domain-containing protein [Candidatus Saccharicenans sp.]|uniref:NYN domain-containing protein n=1 Tax=Candidatus Saccharicenans sp. TaxID=2819258 RepID=UPI0040496B00